MRTPRDVSEEVADAVRLHDAYDNEESANVAFIRMHAIIEAYAREVRVAALREAASFAHGMAVGASDDARADTLDACARGLLELAEEASRAQPTPPPVKGGRSTP